MWSCSDCGLANQDYHATCANVSVDFICGGGRPESAPPTCQCGRSASAPCEACLALLQSDAFSGVDARHEQSYEPPVRPEPDADPYEWAMER